MGCFSVEEARILPLGAAQFCSVCSPSCSPDICSYGLRAQSDLVLNPRDPRGRWRPEASPRDSAIEALSDRCLPNCPLSTGSTARLRKDKQLLGVSSASPPPPHLYKPRREARSEGDNRGLRQVVDTVHPRQREPPNRPHSPSDDRITFGSARGTIAPPHAPPPRPWRFSKRIRNHSAGRIVQRGGWAIRSQHAIRRLEPRSERGGPACASAADARASRCRHPVHRPHRRRCPTARCDPCHPAIAR
jgi:hypothetical protein